MRPLKQVPTWEGVPKGIDLAGMRLRPHPRHNLVSNPAQSRSDSPNIAARIRALIAGQDGGVVEDTARRLGVSELALRMTIDDLAPVPALEVVVAVVREYGVDPTWLVTGQYDPRSHRMALNEDRDHPTATIRALVAARLAPQNSPDVPKRDITLEATG